ncbi:MAG: ABC transporter ATP-binding protein [Phycisphaerales bacterium]|nr:ABC transporter ATP-binding protein [Phycisphaerales bacterium]
MIHPNENAILDIEGLRFVYPRRRGQEAHEALKGVSLRIQPGESVALLGPNGSGKSTLMRLICGMMPPTHGSLRVDGLSDPQQYRTHLSVVFQSNGLDPHLSVEENLQCQASLYGLSGKLAQRRIDEELERGALADRRRDLVKTLSGGLKRRVDLARAMLHHPRLLLLDEPTVGLDPAARQTFLDAIEERQREAGMTLLMSTHLIDEADRCDRAVFVHQGQIVADGPPADLRHSVGEAFVTVHDTQKPDMNFGSPWKPSGSQWVAALDERQRVEAAAALAKLGTPFTVAPPTLADVFASLTGAALIDHASESYTPIQEL